MMQSLDLTGLKCPLPALKTRKALKNLKAGDHLVVMTTDPLASIDIPHVVFETGNTLLEKSETRFLILKS